MPAPAPPAPGPTDDYAAAFESEAIELSAALTEAAAANLDLVAGGAEVEISEAAILAALGAYDVTLTGRVEGSYSEAPQRGSQFTLNLGSRSVSGGVGLQRKLETGGAVELTLNTGRYRQQQPTVIGDGTQGSTTLSAYSVTPTLTVRHSLLQGAGLKVNRAEINKAKIATTVAEAERLRLAQAVARDLIGAYWDLLAAHRDLQNKRRSATLVQEQLERTVRLLAAGRRSKTELKSVEQAAAAKEADVLRAETILLDASLALRKLMGQKLAERRVLGLLPTTDPTVQPKHVVVRHEVARALEVNPQIKQIELSIASYRIDELVAANRRLPRLDVQGSFTPQGRSIDTLGNPTTGEPGTQASWGQAFGNIFTGDTANDGLLADWTLAGSVTLSWDVQNRGAKGARQRAKAEVRKAHARLEQAKQDVTAGVISAANRVRMAGKMIEVTALSDALARDNLDAERVRFGLGRATNYDVLLRLGEADDAAAEALRARVDYLKALADLQALTGEILPAYGLAE